MTALTGYINNLRHTRPDLLKQISAVLHSQYIMFITRNKGISYRLAP